MGNNSRTCPRHAADRGSRTPDAQGLSRIAMPVPYRTGDTTLRKAPDRQTSARRTQASTAFSLSLGRRSRTAGSHLPSEILRTACQGPRSRPCSPERGRPADCCRSCHVGEPDGIRSGPSTECQPGMSGGAGTKPAETWLQQMGSPRRTNCNARKNAIRHAKKPRLGRSPC